ncbi:MAG TPA: rhomboid family intramembrane serine protease, partial [Bacteroidia bacterium]|nr:rhomboid family intramembrane serine protease [Bacteroidia bacterium]
MNYQSPYRPNSFNLLPVVVKNLLIINTLLFFTSYIFENQLGIDLNDKLGLHYPFSPKFQPYQIVTYLFMHGSFFHLFFNMFALWMFGNTLENLWGPKRFLIYYIVTGIGAAICHYTVVYFQMNDAIHFINEYIANPSLNAFDEFTNANGLNLRSSDLLNQYDAKQA